MFSIKKDGSPLLASFVGRIETDPEARTRRTWWIFQDTTARRQSEKALRESREQYRLLTETLKDVVWVLDATTLSLLYVSPSVERLRGYTPEEVLAQSMDQLFTPEAGAALGHRIRSRANNIRSGKESPGAFYTHEIEQLRKDGSTVWTEMIASYRVNPENGRVELLGVSRDISERKQAEQSLRESEAKYNAAYTLMRLLCDNVPDMIWAKDLEKRYIFANTALCRDLLNAADTSEPIGKLDMFFAERERTRYADNPQWHTFGEICRDTDAMTMEAGKPQQFDEYGNVQGKFLFLDVHKAPLIDENGTMIGTVGSARDVTKVKKMEKQLKESEERLKLALFGADLGTWDWHVTSGSVTFNERWASMLGYAPEEIDPHVRSWTRLIHPDDMPYVAQVLQDHCEGRTENYETEHRLRHKAGNWVWVLDKGRIIERDSHGKPVRACGTYLDITQRKQAEEEKKSLQAQLAQAQKMEAIGTLAGGIAHDFNNILTAILGYAELALDDSTLNSAIAEDLNKVLEGGQRAAALVKQILAFSRQTETDRVPLNPVLIIKEAIIKEAIKLLRPTLPSTITIKQRIDPATKAILAAPAQVHQILMNLCTNAFHAMEQTGGTLEIGLRNRDLSPHDLLHQPEVQPGQFIEFSISDSGSGIGPEIREKIFDPYFTTKQIGKGTGMGLAIVHGIVASYHGFITCESAPGKGAIFHVFLPAVEPESIPALRPVETVPGGKEHILLIDDEELLAEWGKTMLERVGYEVTTHTSSPEAMATFRNHPEWFDVVITDQTMPGMTGLDLARQMLQIRPDLPIILCTGYSSLVSEEKARFLGIKGFALKPLSKNDICVLIRKVLDDKGSPEAPSCPPV